MCCIVLYVMRWLLISVSKLAAGGQRGWSEGQEPQGVLAVEACGKEGGGRCGAHIQLAVRMPEYRVCSVEQNLLQDPAPAAVLHKTRSTTAYAHQTTSQPPNITALTCTSHNITIRVMAVMGRGMTAEFFFKICDLAVPKCV